MLKGENNKKKILELNCSIVYNKQDFHVFYLHFLNCIVFNHILCYYTSDHIYYLVENCPAYKTYICKLYTELTQHIFQ